MLEWFLQFNSPTNIKAFHVPILVDVSLFLHAVSANWKYHEISKPSVWPNKSELCRFWRSRFLGNKHRWLYLFKMRQFVRLNHHFNSFCIFISIQMVIGKSQFLLFTVHISVQCHINSARISISYQIIYVYIWCLESLIFYQMVWKLLVAPSQFNREYGISPPALTISHAAERHGPVEANGRCLPAAFVRRGMGKSWDLMGFSLQTWYWMGFRWIGTVNFG